MLQIFYNTHTNKILGTASIEKIDYPCCFKLIDHTNYINIDNQTEINKLIDIDNNMLYYDAEIDVDKQEITVLKTMEQHKEYSLTIEEKKEIINRKVRNKIKKKYDYAQEIKMLNKALIDPDDKEFHKYKYYREQCINWGITEKAKLEEGNNL